MPASNATRTPHLSIVACSRNDGHGENLIERMQLFVDGIADQAERFHLDCELVLVDWNPPDGEPGLSDALRYSGGGGHLTSRVITVPHEVHARLPHSDVLPLFQMIAKNVGIRRARGRMVLSTNIDILFPDVLIDWIASGELDKHALYRVDRADIKVPFGTRECKDVRRIRTIPPIRVNRRDGVYDSHGYRVVPVYTGLLDLARYQWQQIRHRTRPKAVRPAKPTAGSTSHSASFRHGIDKMWRLSTLRKPHINGCGDFTLLSRDNWLRIGGHAEWPFYSWNLDALLLYQARAYGIREIDLPGSFAVLHMDHARGSGWTPDGAADLFARVARRGIPVFTDDQLAREVRTLGLTAMRRPTPRQYSSSDWGYGWLALSERVFPSRAG